MEKTEIINIIDRINKYRMLRFRRDNLKERSERLRVQGYEVAAADREVLLAKAQVELDAVEMPILEEISRYKQSYALHPKDKALKLIILNVQLLETPPAQMEKLRNRINTLRLEVIGKLSEIEQNDEMPLFQ